MSIMFENPNTGVNELILHQWDTNILIHVDIQNTDNAEAMFWQSGYKEALRRTLSYTGQDWVGKVPDIVLENGSTVYVSIVYLDHGRNTVIGPISIPVLRQLKPEGYVSADIPEYIDAIGLIQRIQHTIANSSDELDVLINKANGSIADINNAINSIPPSYEDLLDNLIVFSNVMPVSQYNRIWIGESGEVEIPTMTEFQQATTISENELERILTNVYGNERN